MDLKITVAIFSLVGVIIGGTGVHAAGLLIVPEITRG